MTHTTPHTNPPDHARTSHVHSSPQRIGLSFFTGAGGLDIGMEQAGFTTVLTCETDKHARNTIHTNMPNTGLIGDITNYTTEQIYHHAGLTTHDTIDVIFGGPPCQAFSTAGRRGGFNDTRGNVFLTFLHLAGKISPTYIVIENVRGLLSTTHQPHPNKPPETALETVQKTLQHYGYTTTFNLYNSANFGAPQLRERVIVIAKKGNQPVPHLHPTHSNNPHHNLPPWKTVKEAFSTIPPHTHHEHIDFPEKRIHYYTLLTEGQNWKNLPPHLQEEAVGTRVFHAGGGRSGFLRRLAWNKPSPTLVTNPTMPATDLAHPTLNRPLSVQEYTALQGFPPEWEIAGPVKEKYRQLGNAVPVALAHAIGTTLINDITKNHPTPIPNFPHSRYKNTTETTYQPEKYTHKH